MRGARFIYEYKAKKGEIPQDDPTLLFLRSKDKVKWIILSIFGVLALIGWLIK
jgi:hypothetical protein